VIDETNASAASIDDVVRAVAGVTSVYPQLPEILGLPTLWVPLSYPACLQHGPDVHLLGPPSREALMLMAGLYWDLAETGPAVLARREALKGA
jgi:hypothetical protein